jgi:hypothetical protein
MLTAMPPNQIKSSQSQYKYTISYCTSHEALGCSEQKPNHLTLIVQVGFFSQEDALKNTPIAFTTCGTTTLTKNMNNKSLEL